MQLVLSSAAARLRNEICIFAEPFNQDQIDVLISIHLVTCPDLLYCDATETDLWTVSDGPCPPASAGGQTH